MLVLELALVPVLVIFMPLHGPSHRRPNQHSRDSIGTSLTAPEDDDKDDVAGDGDDIYIMMKCLSVCHEK